jgi:hypothetical protein
LRTQKEKGEKPQGQPVHHKNKIQTLNLRRIRNHKVLYGCRLGRKDKNYIC